MSDQPAGPLIESLGVTLDVRDGQQVTEALVIAKIADFADGGTALVLGISDGLDWIAQRGLLSAAQIVLDSQHALTDDD